MLTKNIVQNTDFYVVKAAHGYLAVSGPASTLQVGVVGASEQEARANFKKELEAWAELAERQESEWL
jgi:uncharacterized protein YciI